MGTSVEACRLVNPAADAAFASATVRIGGDAIIAATLRRAVASTVAPGSILDLRAANTSIAYSDRSPTNDELKRIEASPEIMTILQDGNGEAVIELLDGWKSLEGAPYPVANYLSDFSKTKVLVNEDKQRALVYVARASSAWAWAVASAMPRILPWLTPELGETDKAYYVAVAKGEDETVAALLNAVAAKFDFQGAWQNEALLSYGATMVAEEKARIDVSIKESEDELQTLSRRASDIASDLATFCMRRSALDNAPDTLSGELAKFFADRPQLRVETLNPPKIIFSITEYIEFFDAVEMQKQIDNPGSIYHASSVTETMRRAYVKLFGELKGRLRVSSTFALSGVSHLSPISHEWHDDGATAPHPHIFYHACLGGNSAYMEQFLKNNDWQLAIDQAIGATKNINFNDATVMKELLAWFKANPDKPCIEDASTGEIISMKEFQKRYAKGAK